MGSGAQISALGVGPQAWGAAQVLPLLGLWAMRPSKTGGSGGVDEQEMGQEFEHHWQCQAAG